jgi:hypothetical protein
MSFDWTHGSTPEFALKLAGWFAWAMAQAALDSVRERFGGSLPVSDGVAIGIMAIVALAALWLIIRVIKLLLMGSIAATLGLLALHYIQR